MVLIPASKSQPAFYMDITEVTQGPYQTFQEQTIFRRTPEFAKKKVHGPNYPVRLATWLHAQHFCNWSGKRLPTEEEWDRAAGTGKRVYPWGDEKLDPTRANFCDINCVSIVLKAVQNLHQNMWQAGQLLNCFVIYHSMGSAGFLLIVIYP